VGYEEKCAGPGKKYIELPNIKRKKASLEVPRVAMS
jgi:hypothetical protein